MSEAGFTKGPWHYHANLSGSENHRGFRVYGSSQWVFCEVQPGDEDGREGEANARLIAAAPDLLEALTNLLSQYEGIYDCVDNDGKKYQSQGAADAEREARTAIAKATGAAA